MAFDERSLRAFLAVIDSGSVGRAAIGMHTTQPTLSRLIQNLEQRLGQVLFERQSKGMSLTQAGETFIPHARLLLFEIDQASQAMDEIKGLRRGVVRVGAVASAARALLPQAVANLLAQCPDLKIDFLEAPDHELAEALVERRVDLIVTAEQPPNEDLTPIARCRLVDSFSVFCAATHPLAHDEPVGLDQVLAERWVLPGPGASPRQQFEALVRSHGRPPPLVCVETSPMALGAQIAFVANGPCLGWLPRPLLRNAAENGAICILDVRELRVDRQFTAYRRSRGHFPDGARRLVEFLPLECQ